MTDLGTLGFAFALGLGTFFSPCAIALVPSYAAYFLGTAGRTGWRAGLVFGTWAAAGVAVVFLVLAGALYILRTVVRIDSDSLGSSTAGVGVLVGLAFAVLGILVVAGRGPSWSPRLNRVLERNRRGMFLWGALFSIGSLGCSLPLSLAALALAVNSGIGGLAVLAAYAVGLAGLVLVAGIGLGFAGPGLGRFLSRSARPIQVTMGVLLVAGGLYVSWYYGKQLPF